MQNAQSFIRPHFKYQPAPTHRITLPVAMTSYTTGLFYAYAKNINDDWSWRYLITFASREVADNWFRAVTDSVAGGYPRFADVQRVTPQFYTHNPSVGNIPDTITDPKVAKDFMGKVFFTLINDRDGRILSVIPVLRYADNASGNNFFIKSTLQPDTYWYYDQTSGNVCASRERRTKFTLTIAGNAKPGTTMIGSDDVLISVGSTTIGLTNQNQLTSGDNPSPFKFSSFNGDFQIDFNGGASAQNVGPIVRNANRGEQWELI